MSLAAAIQTQDEDDAMRERRCIVGGEVLSEDRLIRFAVSPDGDIVPDVAATLPGRGIWVEATAKAVATAAKKNLFAKAAKAQVKVAPDLASRVEAVKVEIARRVAAEIDSAEDRKPTAKFLSVESATAGDGAKFALFDQAAGRGQTLGEVGSEVGPKREAVRAKKRGRGELRAVADAPGVAGDED